MSYVPPICNSITVCIIEHAKGGKYALALETSFFPPHNPIGKHPAA